MKITKIIAASISIAAIAANLQPVSAQDTVRSQDVKLSSVCGKVNDNTVGLGEIMLSGKVLNSKGNPMTAVLALKNADNKLVDAKIKNFVPQSDDEEFKISFEAMYDTIGITAEGYLWDGVTMEPVTTKAETVQMTTLSGDDFTAQNGAEITFQDGVISINKAYKQGYCANWFTSLMKYSFEEPVNLRDGQRLTFDCKFWGNPLDWARSFAVCFNGSSSYSQLMVNTDSKFYAGGIVTPISKDKWYGIHFDVNYNYQSTGSGGTLCRVVLYDPDTGEKIAEHSKGICHAVAAEKEQGQVEKGKGEENTKPFWNIKPGFFLFIAASDTDQMQIVKYHKKSLHGTPCHIGPVGAMPQTA